jgi:hypothetical protein
MSKRIGKWSPKLNNEHKTFAMVHMACGETSVAVAKMIKQKWGIDISDTRLRNIRDSKQWFQVYDAAKQKYLAEQVKATAIPIAARENRLREAEKISKKLYRLILKVENAIDDLTENGINKDSAKYVLTLVKTLRETAKIYKDFLSYAKDETVSTKKNTSAGSFLTQINIESKKDDDKPKHLVIETDENRGIQ